MGKRVRFDDDARRALWRGIDQLASAVRITLGPRGRSIVLDRVHGSMPTITRDGIAIAQEMELPDPFENMGVQMLREVALRTGEAAGDGTSTATVLAHRIVGDGFAAVSAGGNPVALRRGIDAALVAALAELAAQARPVEDEHDIAQVASLAAGGDPELGELIAQALRSVGRHGVITVEEGHGLGITLEVVDGVRLATGYASPYFVTDAEDMEVTLEHPLVLVVDGVLTRPAEIVPALEHAAAQQRPLLCVCEDIETEALAVMVVNRLRGTAPGLAVRAPGNAAARRELLEDLALVTGATLLGTATGLAASGARPEHLGRAVSVTAGLDHATLLQGGGRTEALRERMAQLERALEASTVPAEREGLRARLARLSGVIAVLRVGAAGEFEREARRSQVEDALAATRSAVEEGIVPGGGVALVRVATRLEALKLKPLESAGRDIVAAALSEPARQIAHNAGAPGDEVVARLRLGEAWFGYDALTGEYGALDTAGIVDPAKVARCALQNAATLGGLVLTTDALVVDDDKGEAPK
jgi:chaperonin GroEL